MDNLENLSDWDLIEWCKKRDDDAWKELVKRHERSVSLSIQEKLGEKAKDIQLVEDLVQEVLVALIDEEYRRLVLYDAQRSGFDTYLKAIATQIVQQWRRGEGTQIERQVPLNGHEPLEPGGDAGLVQAEFAEYLEDLTPQENRCLREMMDETPGPSAEPPITPGNQRFLRHRLHEKWKDHFDKS
jgi:DNA-directed RNA polymerase specialized sigma24 family protein